MAERGFLYHNGEEGGNLADGSVVISVDLSTGDVDKELGRLKKKMLRLEEDLTAGNIAKNSLTENLKAAQQELTSLQNQAKKGVNGVFENSPENVERIQELQNAIGLLQTQLEKNNRTLVTTQMALDGVKARYSELAQEAGAATPGMGEESIQGSEQAATGLQSMIARVRDTFHGLQEDADVFESKAELIRGVFSAISSITKTVAKTMWDIASGAVKKFASVLKSGASSIGKMLTGSKSISKSFGGLYSSAKRLIPTLLGVRGVIGILRKAVSAFMEQNQQLSNTLSNAWSQLGNVLGPIITKVVNLIASAIGYVSKFLSLIGLTGKTASNQISSAGSAAKKETDKLKKQLMSFDELNVLNDTESDSGGGAGGSGGAANVTLPDWAQLVAEQLKNAQFADAAKTLTAALNDMVAQADWTGIGERIGKSLDGAMTFLATAVQTFDWAGLGSRLADSVNSMVSNVDWSNLGVLLWAKFKIALEMLAGFLTNLDMAQLAQAASNIAISFFNSMSETIQSIDWFALGEQVKTFLVNVDWGGVATAVFEAIGSAFGALTAFLWGLIHDAWEEVVQWWYDVAYEDGEFTLEGLLEGILNAVKDIGTWVWDNIFKPFIDGFCAAFGIHSPSTVMAEQGRYIIQGLLNGITEKWKSVTTWFSTALSDIKDGIANTWDSVRETTRNIWDGIVSTIKGAVNGVIGVINRMISAVVNGINSLFNMLSFNISIPGVGNVGWNLPQFTAPQIPYLAQGAVIPPNAPFMAVLGDQKNGTNVEAPLETIKQAVAEVLSQNGSGEEITIKFTGDLATLARVLTPEITRQQRRTQRALGV